MCLYCLFIEKLYLKVKKICSFHVQWFAEHTGWSWVDRSLDYVLWHSFFGLSFVKVNKYSIQCSEASLDHTNHWIILFIGGNYCFSFLFKWKTCLLEDLIQDHWFCRRPCDPMFHGYLYTCTKFCILPLVYLDYLM